MNTKQYRTLKIKAQLLKFALTCVIFLPVLILVMLALLMYHIKPLRNTIGVLFGELCNTMLEWRTDTVYWYIINQKRGYALEIK